MHLVAVLICASCQFGQSNIEVRIIGCDIIDIFVCAAFSVCVSLLALLLPRALVAAARAASSAFSVLFRWLRLPFLRLIADNL